MAGKKKKEEKIVEREMIVPLVKAFERPRSKRAKKAVNILKAFMKKHFRMQEQNILVSTRVNEAIWARGIESAPRRLKVKVILDSEKLWVLLPGEKLLEKEKKEKPKKEKEEKTEAEKKEMEKKKEEKKEMEKEAEAIAIKRGTK